MAKILYIEDEPELTQAVRTKLQKEGFEVETAENGKAGWKIVEKDGIDCVVLDVVMPHADGVWFLKKLRDDPVKTKIPVIVFTNLSEGDKVSKIVALGEYRLLLKAQTSMQTLVNTVKEVLRLYKK